MAEKRQGTVDPRSLDKLQEEIASLRKRVAALESRIGRVEAREELMEAPAAAGDDPVSR